MNAEAAPTAGEERRCWRSECRTSCYYPDVCSERSADRIARSDAAPHTGSES